MSRQDRLAVDPAIKGTRIAVEFILELLAEGWAHEQIGRSYPSLVEGDIQAALHHAAEAVKRERVYSLTV